MVLAFRLFGQFLWPPTPSKPTVPGTPPPTTQAGVVEIHFVERSPGKLSALLHWIGQETQGSDDAPVSPDPKLNIQDMGANAVQWFDQFKEKTATIWVDNGTANTNNWQTSWVAFRGAFLFEQYEQADPDPRRQWPLVRACQYYDGKTSYSALMISEAGLRLDMHAPLPVPRRVNDNAWTAVHAFPFFVLYGTTRNAGDILTPKKLFAGWFEPDSSGPTLSDTTSYEISGADLPANLKLGEFGFTPNRDSHPAFAQLDGTGGNSIRRYWPKSLGATLQSALSDYGFAIATAPSASPTGKPFIDLSLRFTGANRLTYRVATELESFSSSGDLRWIVTGPFRLKLRDEIGGRMATDVQYGSLEKTDPGNAEDPGYDIPGWLQIGKKIFVDCELSWRITRSLIWSKDRSADWSPTVALRLHWDEIFAAGKLSTPAAAGTDFNKGLLPLAGSSFETVRSALVPAEAGLPHSFLPTLTLPSLPTFPPVRLCLYGTPIAASFDGHGLVHWGRSDHAQGWRRPPMRLSIAARSSAQLIDREIVDARLFALTLEMSRLTFFQTAGVSFLCRLEHDASWPPGSADTVDDDGTFFASYGLRVNEVKTEAGAPDLWSGRLAGLEFSDLKRQIDARASKTGHLRVGGKGERTDFSATGSVLVYPDGRAAAQVRMPIPVTRVEQIAVDTHRGDRSGRPAPLLIPLEPRPTAGPTTVPPIAYWLTATETTTPRQDRWLEADLLENTPDAGARSYVVLASEPFSVLRFRHLPLSDRGDAESGSVAIYSSDDRLWQYKRVSSQYHYSLPPQAIGESADKPRRLEIHDLDPPDDPAPRPFITTADAEAPDQRRAVEYRLTPSAEFWIKPSDVERGYFMPESTSYEIFRQSGAYGLGAALTHLRAEFLYGLPVGIDIAKETGIVRGARIAEIEALTGRLAGPMGPIADKKVSDRWNALRAAVARRSERLEIWARDLDSTVDFTPARFSAGARFALRGTAVHRMPTGPEIAADYKWAPEGGGDDLAAGKPASPRYHPQGLSGGALWPVESLNLFKILRAAPESYGGVIEQIALSPMGGDAAQKALFLDGKVTIISETRNGHVERQQVEVLGRICAFWHRAKHVVIYERTVNASAQFAPESKQGARSRRPILRKVSEYIELLQPERTYPDFANAEARSAGFLERVRFNSNIINVDSAWSSDIGNFGWKIPLWNRLSARKRPQVYPMPDIAFVTTAEGDAERPVVAQDCLDPDYLFFFADFEVPTSDTDQWQSRLDLDYPNMPAAKTIAEVADTSSRKVFGTDDDYTEGRRRSVSRFLPGLRQFTWRLAPAGQKTALNAGRTGKPVYVGLDSVTFMRALQQAQQGLDEDRRKLLVASAAVDLNSDAAKALAKLPYWKADGTDSGFADIGSYNDYFSPLGAIGSAIAAGNGAGVKTLIANLKNDWTTGKQLRQNLLAHFTKTPITAGDFSNFTSKLKSGGAFCEKLKQDAVGMIQRKEMLVRTALHDLVGDGKQLANKMAREVTKEKATALLRDEAITQIRPLFTEASQDIAKAAEGVEKVRSTLLDLEAEMEAIFLRARQRIQQFVSGYDQSMPWSEGRRKAFRAGITACIASVAADIDAVIDEARQRLGIELNAVSQAIGGHVAKALDAAVSSQIEANAILTHVGAVVDRLLVDIESRLNKLGEMVGTPPEAKIDKLIADAEAKLAAYPNFIAALKTIRDRRQAALDLIQTAREQAQTVDAEADKALGSVKGAIQAVVDALTLLAQDLTGAVEALADDIEAVGAVAADLAAEISGLLIEGVSDGLDRVDAWAKGPCKDIEDALDAVILPATDAMDRLLTALRDEIRRIPDTVLPIIDDVSTVLDGAQAVLAPGKLVETAISDKIILPVIDRMLLPLPEDLAGQAAELTALLTQFEERVGEEIRGLSDTALGALEEVTAVCKSLHEGIDEVTQYLTDLAGGFAAAVEKKLDETYKLLTDKFGNVPDQIENVQELLASLKALDYSVRGIQNNLSRAYETARVYADRVFDLSGKLTDGGVMAAPCNVLKLYSAVTSAPELAALKADIDRLRANFDELADIIETTKANALLNRLGDELKGLGLSLPFDRISDRLLPADLSNLDIGKVFRNFGGAKLDRLFKGYRVPAGIRDAIKITHDFDKKQARAWVQVDINAPMPGRRSLFSVGVFKADFVDMQLIGQIRLEASKDQDKVTQTGFGRIGTVIDLVVGGQSMVSFTKFGLNFTKEKGLEVDFDPSNIRLNPQFKFIQDFLSTLFGGDEPGGLKKIMEGGLPVGVEHEFLVPPLSLNFGTSGVSNISIENRFRLVAYPDFMLADRFNLSTVERPYIFSIFIIGGTGYIQIEAQYRPFDNELSVLVEAGAGGSASLAFAFGPFSGQVFITLSGVLAYRKTIGKPGGGLSISVVLVIAGHVDVAGIITVGITLMLRMTYRDNGQVDGEGSLSVTIRISKFFKLRARANVKYKLRGGKSQTQVTTKVDSPDLEKIQKAAKKLEEARS